MFLSSIWDKAFLAFRSFPEYLKEGIVTLIVTIISGITVAYITTKVFQRFSEVIRVKGILTERRIEVYKNLSEKLEELNNLVYFHSYEVKDIRDILDNINIKINTTGGIKICEFFTSSKILHEKFLDFDKYALENRIFYDEDVYNEILFLQNYLGLIAHIRIIFEESLSLREIDLAEDKKEKLLDRLLVSCGTVLTENFTDQILRSVDVIRKSMNDVKLKSRKSHPHTYSYFNDPEGPVMSRIKETGIEEDLINVRILTEYFTALLQHSDEELKWIRNLD